tara:strand:+ start:4492 stop:4752 length:261 start_codon:yes stop_codon:yes gene_type:complete
MADQTKFEKTNDEKAEMETTINGALLKELFESVDVTIDNANKGRKGQFELSDGTQITFSLITGKATSLRLTVVKGKNSWTGTISLS